MTVVANYTDTTGLYTKTKFIQIYAAIINLILSVLLGKCFGLAGIIMATIISRLATSAWFEPRILYKDFFKDKVREFYSIQCKYFTVMIIVYAIIYIITKKIPVDTMLTFLCKTVVCVIMINVLFVILFGKTREFKDLLNKCKLLIK